MEPELLTCETPQGDGKTTFPMGRSINDIQRENCGSASKGRCVLSPSAEPAHEFRSPEMPGRFLILTNASRSLSPHLLLPPAWRATLPPHLTAPLRPRLCPGSLLPLPSSGLGTCISSGPVRLDQSLTRGLAWSWHLYVPWALDPHRILNSG